MQEFDVVADDVFALTKRQMRQPVLDRIARSEALFGEEIRQLWQSESTLSAVRDYVSERLGA